MESVREDKEKERADKIKATADRKAKEREENEMWRAEQKEVKADRKAREKAEKAAESVKKHADKKRAMADRKVKEKADKKAEKAENAEAHRAKMMEDEQMEMHAREKVAFSVAPYEGESFEYGDPEDWGYEAVYTPELEYMHREFLK